MSQAEELAAVKRKIRGALARTVEAGATVHEADTAMRIVGDLMTQFNLTLNDVLIKQESYVTKNIAVGLGHLGVIGIVATSIARLTDTKCWYTRHYDPDIGKYKKMNFFGIESDADMAIYLCQIVRSSYDRAYEEYKRTDDYKNYNNGHRKTLASNFMNGFGQRINTRILQLIVDRAQQQRKAAEYHAEQMKSRMIEMSEEATVKVAEYTTGTALMVINKMQHTEDEFSKLGMTLRSTTRSAGGRHEAGSRGAGSSAANSVNLSRPMGGGSKTTGYLK